MTLAARLSGLHVERVISGMRVALASASLFAVWMDPAEPYRYAGLTYALHSGYVVYALVMGAIAWRRDAQRRGAVVGHFVDIAVASVLQYLTLGPSSPFFVFFVFALFSAALRWGWRGALQTSGIVLVAYVVMGLSLSRTLGPTEFELNRFIIRISYLLVIALALVYLGQHEERLRQEVRQLARWPIAAGRSLGAVVPQLLEHSARIVGAERAALVWGTDEEPWLYVASWPIHGQVIERYPPDTFDPIVPEALAEATFLCHGALSADVPTEVSRAGHMTTWRGLAVHPGLVGHLPGTSVASTPFRTERLAGRVFFGVLSSDGTDLLPIVEVIGREIGSSLDQLSSFEHSRQLAISEDRIRLARDLHDGVLQSLTGIRLELQNMAGSGGGSGLHANRLHEIERALALEQRELRRFIEDLKPTSDGDSALLAARLGELRGRLALEWPTPITITVDPPKLAVPAVFGRAIPLMVHEAIVNAFKHGKPSEVSVAVRCVDGVLSVVVADNGRGFPFVGRREHAALSATNAGPVSLRERVASLGGQIAVESSPGGSRVELSMPLEALHA